MGVTHGGERTIPADNATIGSFLHTLRKNRRLTMERAAQEAGLHRTTLQRWETGQGQPRLPELEALLSALNAGPAERSQAIAFVEAPRARTLMREAWEQKARQMGAGPMPHGGELLRAMRLRRGRSLDDIALHLGVTTWTLRRWEKAETWPSEEQLRRLCDTLQAHAEETLALTDDWFALTSLTGSNTGAPTKAARELAERMEQYLQMIHEPPFALRDLELLALRAQAWALASRSSLGLRLLAEAHALTCYFFGYRDRHRETVTAGERYFDLTPEMPQDERGRSLWLTLRLRDASARLCISGPTSIRRSQDVLRHVLPLARGTKHEPGTLMRISEALMLQGVVEEALQISAASCDAALRILGEDEAEQVRGGLGIQLIRCGRHAEGLPLLSTGKAGDWYRLVETSLWKAEALLGLGERTETQRCLTQAQADLDRYEMTPLQSRLNALQARLDGEPTGNWP